MILLLVIGNPRDIKCWSGTPYFILNALQSKGYECIAPNTNYHRLSIVKYIWALSRLLVGKRPKGFQYSKVFEFFFVKPHIMQLKRGDLVLSLNTHIPSKELIDRLGLTVVHYDDSTVEQIVYDPHYYWSSISPQDKWVLEKEKKALEASTLAIGMTEFARQGMERHLGAQSEKTHYILGGINIPDEISFQINVKKAERGDCIHFGLIAVDPDFKGYDELKVVMELLEQKGIRCQAHVIGGMPLKPSPNTHCYGFINKIDDPDRFVDIVSKLDYGWLYPKFEAFGITVLEFYSYEIPMVALAKFGPASTASNKLGIAIDPNDTMDSIASRIFKHWQGSEYSLSKSRIRAIKHMLTWERAVDEILACYHFPDTFTPFRLPQ